MIPSKKFVLGMHQNKELAPGIAKRHYSRKSRSLPCLNVSSDAWLCPKSYWTISHNPDVGSDMVAPLCDFADVSWDFPILKKLSCNHQTVNTWISWKQGFPIVYMNKEGTNNRQHNLLPDIIICIPSVANYRLKPVMKHINEHFWFKYKTHINTNTQMKLFHQVHSIQFN